MPSKRILIVDDEPRVGFFLKESLESLGRGYTVAHVPSGEAALDEMAREPYHLVVTDLRMPGMSGLDLLSRVREVAPDTRTILITAYGSDEVETASQRLKASYYFTKPFPIDDFTSAVQDALEDRSSASAEAPSLDHERLDRIAQRLSDLRFEVGAQCILLANAKGALLTEVGLTEGLTPALLTELMGGGFASLFEVARHLHEGRAFNLTYHEGVRYDIYAANVGDHLFLTLVFDRRQGASRIGMVWLYTKRAIQDLLDLASPSARPAA
ncbi:MAG TPA: response regulator [Anaerolineae bacterium]|nr:response regulator [Anaerolineae bacterium]